MPCPPLGEASQPRDQIQISCIACGFYHWGSLSLLQENFPTRELNQDLLHCRQILYQLSYHGSQYRSVRYPQIVKIIFEKKEKNQRTHTSQFKKWLPNYSNQIVWYWDKDIQFSSIQSLSPVQLFATPWTAPRQDSLSITNSQSLLKLRSIESVMPSNHLILCCPLLLQRSIFLSIRVFSSGSVLCIWWPKYWNFSLCISPSSEYSGLISFSTNWCDLLAVQGTLKNLL